MPHSAISTRPTSPMLSARHEVGTYVSDTRQTNKRMSVNRHEPIVQHSNGEPARAKSPHRPVRSPRSTYVTDKRWDDLGLKTTAFPLHSPGPLIQRLAAPSLSPACQHRGTHLSARARARSIELGRCTGATQKGTAAQQRRGPVETCERHHQVSRPYALLWYRL